MKIKSLIYLSLLSMCISLSGCSKHEEVVVSSADFGESESTEENVNKDYSIDIEQQTLSDYIYETEGVDKKVEKSLKSNIQVIEDNQKELKDTLGNNYVNESINNNSDYEQITDDILVSSMRNQIFSGEINQSAIDNLNVFIEDNFIDMSQDEKQLIYNYILECWDNYNKIQESLAALPESEHWTEKELQENPDLKNYSRSEIEYIDNYHKEHFGKEK